MQLPTITINTESQITLRRVLPVSGEILVHPGQTITAQTIVAQAETASNYQVIDVARQLGRSDIDMDEVLQVEPGEEVEANQLLASLAGGLSFFQRSVKAPVAGHVANIGPGWILLETEWATTELSAFINGKVNRVVPNRGVILETTGAMIEAACGFGGETYGRLRRRVDSPFEMLEVGAIDESASESIVLGGRTVNEETLRRADEWRVRGIIVGSIESSLLNLDPPVKVRVVATEGFGNLSMSAYTFSVLTSLSRKHISMRGVLPLNSRLPKNQRADKASIILATSERQSNQPHYNVSSQNSDVSQKSEAKTGSRVRLIQGELLGASGTIESIPAMPQATEAGIISPGVKVKVNNVVYYVPWANLELIV